MRSRSSRALMAAAAAALLLLLLSLAAAYMSYSERMEEEETRRMFVEWMARYHKSYDDMGEQERRYAVFKDNRRSVDRYNADANNRRHGYRQGLNVFADLTTEELHEYVLIPGALLPSEVK